MVINIEEFIQKNAYSLENTSIKAISYAIYLFCNNNEDYTDHYRYYIELMEEKFPNIDTSTTHMQASEFVIPKLMDLLEKYALKI